MSDPWTPDQLKAAGSQVQPPPVGTGPVNADVSAGSATEVDVNALLAQLQAQQAAMAARIAELEAAGKVTGGAHPLIQEAEAARELIGIHYAGRKGEAELTRLADDLVDAAKNAVASGDTSAVRKIAAGVARGLHLRHAGPGDQHYFTNALQLVEFHIPAAADTVTAPQPSGAPALGGGAPATVIAGSVTG